MQTKLNGKKGLIAAILTMAIVIGAYNGVYYTWTVSYSVEPLTQFIGSVPITIPPTSGATIGEDLAAQWIPRAIGEAYAWYDEETVHKGFSSAELYVWDGWVDWAEVSIPVDIAIGDIDELKFWKMVTYFDSGWNPNVYLCIDADGDGVFEADLPDYHFNQNLPASDAFIALEYPTALTETESVFTEFDALAQPTWSVDKNGQPSDYGIGFSEFKTTTFGEIDPTDSVLMIKLVIGGAGSWMNEEAYVDDVTINGESYDIDAVVASFEIVKPCYLGFMVTEEDRLALWDDYFELYVYIDIFDEFYEYLDSVDLNVLTGVPPSGDVYDYISEYLDPGEGRTYYALVWVEYWTGAVAETSPGDFVINIWAEEVY